MIDKVDDTFEKIPTTCREADLLARRHGFESTELLAASLPHNASIIDLGAGESDFGNSVARLRPDIHWTNFDIKYSNASIARKARANSPPNAQYVQGDVTRLTEICQPEIFDIAYSYWLLPHLSLRDREPAEAAAAGIYDILKGEGYLSVGPSLGKSLTQYRSRINSERVFKHEHAREGFTTYVADLTSEYRGFRWAHRFTNEVRALRKKTKG